MKTQEPKLKDPKMKTVMAGLRPVLILALLIPIVAFMYYPMANMNPRDINIGIVNLDTGAQFEQGQVNVGEKIVDKITDTSDSETESPVNWQSFESKKDAEKALNCNKIYAYLVIPRDFSGDQTATLEALSGLGGALGGISTGVDKLGSGVTQMGSKLGNIPSTFSKLSDASGNMADLAGSLGGITSSVDNETQKIESAAASVSDNNEIISGASADADRAIAQLKQDVADGADQGTIDKDIADIERAYSTVVTANNDTSDNIGVILQNTKMISAQNEGLGKGIAGIKTFNTNMSVNFDKTADKMSAIGPGVNKMSQALTPIGDGLGTMSENLNDKVSDAIDAVNSTSDEEGSTDAAPLKFYINQANNVLIPTTLSGMINGMSSKTGMKIETIYVNELPEGTDSMYFIMAFMMICMFCTILPSILTGLSTQIKGYADLRTRSATVAQQLVISLLIACILGICVPRVVSWICGTPALDYSSLTPFIIVFCMGLILLTLGFFDMFGKIGIAVPALTMICGTGVAVLPYEFLPSFWQKYIYPWEPLRMLTDGIRHIIYRNGSWLNDCTQPLLWMAAAGIILMLLSLLKSRREQDAVQQ